MRGTQSLRFVRNLWEVTTMIKVGKPAPDFTLDGVIRGEVQRFALHEYKGKWIVFFFYPEDFTYICPTEITGFSHHAAEFKKLNAEVFGCSTDSTHSHKAWAEREKWNLAFPLLADPTRQTSADYDVLVEEKGIALRGTFIIDPDGILRWAVISDLNVGRSVAETLRALQALQTGELCGVEWKPGEKTLG